MVIKASILTHYKPGTKTIIKTDLSHSISNRVFSQRNNNRLFFLSAYFFKDLNSAKYNYEINYKKLLAIIRYFE